MKYIVALNIKTRFARPNIGNFIYSMKHERHVWRNKETADIAELAELVNEALQCSLIHDQIDLHVRVHAVAPLPTDPDAPRPRGRPRKNPLIGSSSDEGASLELETFIPED